MMISPLAKGLVHRAIIESGSCAGPVAPAATSVGLQQSNAMLVQNKWPTDNITFLRSIPALEFVSKMQGAFQAVDGEVLTDEPRNLYSDPSVELNVESVINGFNSMDDFMPWGNGNTPMNERQYRKAIENVIQNTT